MKKQEKMIFTLLALFVALLIITSCTVKSKVEMKQDKMNVSSSTKGDTEVLKQKHIKSNDPEVVQVKYDWDSVKVGDSGAFTESGFDIRLKVYGANNKELNGYSFFIVPKPNVENPSSIDSISGSNFP